VIYSDLGLAVTTQQDDTSSSRAGGVSMLPFGNRITETRTWNNLFEQTSISAGSLSLGY
jgi:hypothetical protein